MTAPEPVPGNTSRVKTQSVRMRAAAILAVPILLAFTVPPFGFLASFSLPVLAARVRPRLWPRISPATGHLYAALALIGLWLPALLALVSNGRIGSEATTWLVLPLCAPSGAALLVPAALALLTYLAGLTASVVSRSPLPWVLGTWGAPMAYWAASSWLVNFSCVA